MMKSSDITPTETNTLDPGDTLDGEGAVIRTDTYTRPLIEVPAGCTVRNLDLVGPFITHTENGGWWDYEKSGTAWHTAASAIKITGSNVTIENVTCRGWSFGGIVVGDSNDPAHEDVRIRECSLRDNNCRALGYGVVVYAGVPTIEWCDFQNNRHDIAQGGRPNAGYEARYCHVGDTGRIYGFEAHGPHSAKIHVHHCTFEDKMGNTPRKGFDRRILIRNRGTPVEECTVENNWFKGRMTVKMSDESREWYTFDNNHEGPSPPPDGVGQPVREDDPDPIPANDTRTIGHMSALQRHVSSLKKIRDFIHSDGDGE